MAFPAASVAFPSASETGGVCLCLGAQSGRGGKKTEKGVVQNQGEQEDDNISALC